MESKLLTPCGLHCGMCPAYIATLSGDINEKEKVASQWSKQFNTEIKAEDINCMGCRTDGAKFNYCEICEIRSCNNEKKIDNCGFCDTYPCSKLDHIFVNHGEIGQIAKDTLGSIYKAKNLK